MQISPGGEGSGARARTAAVCGQGGGRCGRPREERAFRALSPGPACGDCGWRRPQMRHLQRRDNGGVATTDRVAQPEAGVSGAAPAARTRSRAPRWMPAARQSAEAAAAAPRGVTAPSQWLCWRRARDCTAGRRRAAREGRRARLPPPSSFAKARSASAQSRRGKSDGSEPRGADRGGEGSCVAGGHARPPPGPRGRRGARPGYPGTERALARGWPVEPAGGRGIQASLAWRLEIRT